MGCRNVFEAIFDECSKPMNISFMSLNAFIFFSIKKSDLKKNPHTVKKSAWQRVHQTKTPRLRECRY